MSAVPVVEVVELSGTCHGRYVSGEFAGMRCIERAREDRLGVGLCRRHARALDAWLKWGVEYAYSMARFEWGVNLRTLATTSDSSAVAPKDSSGPPEGEPPGQPGAAVSPPEGER